MWIVAGYARVCRSPGQTAWSIRIPELTSEPGINKMIGMEIGRHIIITGVVTFFMHIPELGGNGGRVFIGISLVIVAAVTLCVTHQGFFIMT